MTAWRVARAGHWLFAGTGLGDGDGDRFRVVRRITENLFDRLAAEGPVDAYDGCVP